MREMQIEVPTDLMTEVVEIIEKDGLGNTIIGTDEDDRIVISLSYPEKKRSAIMEILELIEDYDDGEEEEDDDEDDN